MNPSTAGVLGVVVLVVGGMAAAVAVSPLVDQSRRSSPRAALPAAVGPGATVAPTFGAGVPVRRIVAPTAAASATRVAEATIEPEEDRLAVLGTALQVGFESDPPATRESIAREAMLRDLFSHQTLGDHGSLQDLSCRAQICRGTVRISSEQADAEVFRRTFLSPEFGSRIDGAVTVASRAKMPDGAVLATFFIHPQDAFAATADSP